MSRQDFFYARDIEKKTGKKNDEDNLEELVTMFRDEYLDNHKGMPIFANYGAHRAVHVVPVKRIRTKHEFDKLSAFDKAIVKVIDFRVFFELFRDRQELGKDKRVRQSVKMAQRQMRTPVSGFSGRGKTGL